MIPTLTPISVNRRLSSCSHSFFLREFMPSFVPLRSLVWIADKPACARSGCRKSRLWPEHLLLFAANDRTVTNDEIGRGWCAIVAVGEGLGRGRQRIHQGNVRPR